MIRVAILTSSELRHTFFRKYLALQKGIEVLVSFCESSENNLIHKVQDENPNDLRYKHLQARKQAEQDFFALFCDNTLEKSNSITIPKGAINDAKYREQLIKLNPDIVVSFGCSIIKPELIDAFSDKFINIHLGLSPHYRGSGTNFWPFVNFQPEYCGVTFMRIDTGIDTGEVIHQLRPQIFPTDNFHTICNRLLKTMAEVCVEILYHFNILVTMPQLIVNQGSKYYKNSDFTERSVGIMKKNFNAGMINDYLKDKNTRDYMVPIICNSAFTCD
jgi:phosphoribosylglycinamide formyltransferase 1